MTKCSCKVLLPTEALINEAVSKVIAEPINGSFGLLPRHSDFVTALVPGILSFYAADGTEYFAVVDQGILVKVGDQVSVSTIKAVRSADLDQLRATIAEQFPVLDEREPMARSALARLEAGTMRRYMKFEEQGHG